MTVINQDEINNIVWKACDTFRGVVDPSEYKNYILVFLFIKYISDVWKDKYEEMHIINGNKHEILKKLFGQKDIFPMHKKILVSGLGISLEAAEILGDNYFNFIKTDLGKILYEYASIDSNLKFGGPNKI